MARSDEELSATAARARWLRGDITQDAKKPEADDCLYLRAIVSAIELILSGLGHEALWMTAARPAERRLLARTYGQSSARRAFPRGAVCRHMKHAEPPENLPVVDEPAVSQPATETERPTDASAEDVHFRDRAAGDTVTMPIGGQREEPAGRLLGDCPSTTNETSPMEQTQTQPRVDEAAFMTAVELAAWLGTTRYSVYTLVRKDGLPCYRYGGTLRFRRTEVEEFLKDRRRSGPATHGSPQN